MNVKKLDQISHVLIRPDMYTGSNEMIEREQFVLDSSGKRFTRERVVVNLVLNKIFDELLVNARDHSVRDASMTMMKVVINESSFSIENDGTTIPIEKSEYGPYVPELVFGHLLSGSNFDDDEERVVGGRNGLGAKLANIWSTQCIVQLCDGATTYRQRFSNNMRKIGKPSIRPAKPGASSFTRITVSPDFEKLGISDTKIPPDTARVLTRRIYDIAATSRCVVKLGARRVPCSTFRQYTKMFAPDGSPVVLYETTRWRVAIFPSFDAPGPRIAFVNGVECNAGTHVSYIANQIAKHVRAKLKFPVSSATVLDSIGLIIDSVVVNPVFTNQQKETLTTPVVKFGSSCVLPVDTLTSVCSKKFGLIDHVNATAVSKLDAAAAKNDSKRTRVSIPKLTDAIWAGGPKASACSLILCEGDSAKTMAISGLSADDRKTFGVFPLRGKLINVRGNSAAGLKNAEIQSIKRVLGLEHKKQYTTTAGLRYGRVIVMTDADLDGSHIKGLLLNFFDVEFPGLLAIPGFIAEFITPLVKATRGTQCVSFFSNQEYETWRAIEDRSGWNIKYYKGLGTSTSSDAKKYFKDIDRHIIQLEDDVDRPESLDLAFSKKRAHDRRDWIRAHDDSGRGYDTGITISKFVHADLVNFSVADVRRSIPDVVDGLKPSQRKVLFAAFKRKLTSDIKVAQLAGYISEVAAYHHGEASLQSTIISLARDYVGSNNINFLVPSGQFGTRLGGGADHASARYIFTRLAQTTRAIFPERDDAVLNYLEDDGQRVEPGRYVPIIPVVLVNGCTGIGTGFSTFIPGFDVRDVISAVRARIRGERVPDLTPSYRGFFGSVDDCDGGYISRGVFSVGGRAGTCVTITELPIGTWTSPYVEWLESQSFASRVIDESTETSVQITFTTSDKTVVTHEGLKLETKLSTTNMTLFDADGSIKKFSNVAEIIESHYRVRHAAYARRKAHELAGLAEKINVESNRARFVRHVVDGSLIIANRPVLEIERDMNALGIECDPGLLRMQIRSLTREKVDELVQLVDSLRETRATFESISIESMWENELLALENHM